MNRFGISQHRLAALANDERAQYVAINVGVNVVFLVRSFVTMQLLDFRDLGLVALMQSIILLLTTLQFGFLQGGYRLLCSAQADEAKQINNLFYSFSTILCLVSIVVGSIILMSISGDYFMLVGAFGIVGGMMTLLKTWITNQLIAKQNLRRLNIVSVVSAVGAMAMFGFAPFDPLIACLLAVIFPPVVFALMVIIFEPSSRPTAFAFPWDLTKKVMRTGFLIFLAGIFLQVNVQLERFYVVSIHGLDALGHLYLVILFLTIFQLIPSSFDAIFLPKLVNAHNENETSAVRRALKIFAIIIIGYLVVSVGAVALLAEPIVGLVLPKYVGDLKYVYILLPGLVMFTLAQPFSIVFNVLIHYRYFFIGYGGTTLLTAGVFLVSIISGRNLALDEVIAIRSLAYALIAVVVVIGFLVITRRFPEFRFLLAKGELAQ